MEHLKSYNSLPQNLQRRNNDKQWFSNFEYLNGADVVPGMIGYNKWGERVEVKEIHKFADVTEEDEKRFRHYNKLSEDEWVSFLKKIRDIYDDDYFVILNGKFEKYSVTDDFYLYVDTVRIPVTEKWKNSNILRDANKNTGVLENLQNSEFLNAVDVRPGMVGIDFENKQHIVERVFNVGEMRKDRKKMYDYLFKNSNWNSKNIKDATSGRFLNNSDYLCKIENKDLVLTYGEETFVVPESEAWKKDASDVLKDVNSLSGVLEKINVLESLKDEEYLNDDEITSGMIAHFKISNNKIEQFSNVEILNVYKISEITQSDFENLQKLSKSQWLSYHIDMFTNSSGTLDYFACNSRKPFKSLSEILNDKYMTDESEECKLITELKRAKYLAIIKTKIDALCNKDYDVNHDESTFIEVIPLQYLKVPVAERWKSSRQLKDTNTTTGILERSLNKVDWSAEYALKFLKPEEISAGMEGITRNSRFPAEIVEVYQLKDIDDELFNKINIETSKSSNWFRNLYVKDETNVENPWLKTEYLYKDLNDFLDKNPFVIMSHDDYIVVAKSLCDFNGICGIREELEVFPYDLYNFAVLKTEHWKHSKKLRDSNSNGVFEKN